MAKFSLPIPIIFIINSSLIVDYASGGKVGIAAGLSQCLDVLHVPVDCPLPEHYVYHACSYLKCTSGDITGCVRTQAIVDKTPKEICDLDGDTLCQQSGHGSLKHGDKVCQMCTPNNCNTGNPSDGNWYSH